MCVCVLSTCMQQCTCGSQKTSLGVSSLLQPWLIQSQAIRLVWALTLNHRVGLGMIISEDTIQGSAQVHSTFWHTALMAAMSYKCLQGATVVGRLFCFGTLLEGKVEKIKFRRLTKRWWRQQDFLLVNCAVLGWRPDLAWYMICHRLTAREALDTSGSQQKGNWMIHVFRQ